MTETSDPQPIPQQIHAKLIALADLAETLGDDMTHDEAKGLDMIAQCLIDQIDSAHVMQELAGLPIVEQAYWFTQLASMLKHLRSDGVFGLAPDELSRIIKMNLDERKKAVEVRLTNQRGKFVVTYFDHHIHRRTHKILKTTNPEHAEQLRAEVETKLRNGSLKTTAIPPVSAIEQDHRELLSDSFVERQHDSCDAQTGRTLEGLLTSGFTLILSGRSYERGASIEFSVSVANGADVRHAQAEDLLDALLIVARQAELRRCSACREMLPAQRFKTQKLMTRKSSTCKRCSHAECLLRARQKRQLQRLMIDVNVKSEAV